MAVLASIDAGSNAVRMAVLGYAKGSFKRLRYERIPTRLASGLESGGALRRENIELTLAAFKKYAEMLGGFARTEVFAFRAVGTSALREAGNSSDLVRRVFEETGIKIEVISAGEEASLSALGILTFLPGLEDALALDIGGGSTEWMYIVKRGLSAWGSIPAGVVKLAGVIEQKGLGGLDREREKFGDELARSVPSGGKTPSAMVLAGGTAAAIASLDLGLGEYRHDLVHGHRVALTKVEEIYRRMLAATPEERRRMLAFSPDRADLIIPGAGLTITAMKRFFTTCLTASDTGLPEGVAVKLAGKLEAK